MKILTILICGMAISSYAATIPTGVLPQEVYEKAKALGDRFDQPGHERVVYRGTLTRKGASIPVTITCELPAKVKVDIGAGEAIGFDGSAAWHSAAALSADDLDLIESLSDDSPEAFIFSAVQGQHGLRPLIHRARMDDGKAPVYNGPWVDVYQQAGPVQSRPGAVTRQKHFYFDSLTHLPTRVRYVSPAGARIDVVRSDWKAVDGQYAPSTITRYENGQAVLSLSVISVGFGPGAADSVFAH